MPPTNSGEEILDYSLVSPEKYKSVGELKQKLYAPYRLFLFLTDVFLICSAFYLASWMNGYRLDFHSGLHQTAIVLVFSMITWSFFLTCNIYSYHLIFSPRFHVKRLCIALSWSLLTVLFIFTLYALPQVFQNRYFIPLLIVLAIILLLLSRFFYDQLLNILKVMGVSFLAIGFISLMNPDSVPEIIANPLVILTGFLLSVLFLNIGRMFIVHVVFNVWMRRQFRRQVIIIGSNSKAEDISNHIINYNAPFWIEGIVSPIPEQSLNSRIEKFCLGGLKDLPDIIARNKTDEIIVTDEQMSKSTLISIIDFCTSAGINVWFPPKLMPIIDVKLLIDNFCGIPMIRLNAQKNKWVLNKIKHGVDALIALPLLILLSPFFVFMGIAVKINSKGPVFYKARAIGKNGIIFSMYKFRTMGVESSSDAHKDYVTKLIKGEITNGGSIKQPLKIMNDPRVTRVGKILRKLSLDELPQLINVIKGDMSLVGPRPCLPYEYEIYKDWHKKRTLVRSGITGLWQVAGRSEVDFEDMILLDLYYIYNHNLAMDLSTLYETIFVVLGQKGAY